MAGIAIWMFRLWARHQLDINNEAKLRFFIDIAHEFRSPITLMKAPLDKLIKQPGNDDKTIRALHNIDRKPTVCYSCSIRFLTYEKSTKAR